MNERQSETRQQGGFSEKDKDEEGNKKNGRVDKNRRGCITQERLSRFLPLQFAFFYERNALVTFPPKIHTK